MAVKGVKISIIELFDLYRIFYKQPSDREDTREHLKQLSINNESVVFIALEKR